ncbi:MAG: HAD-IA family hydrolase [Candidatus Altiarchaeota archaeon]|nr:HAD-IA family hydrolase [Candidatus Altiarchaeota archaeon]
MGINTIIFDFDGVIANGVKVHFDFYKDLCKIHHKKPPFSNEEEFREWFEPLKFRKNYHKLNIPLKDHRNLNYTEYINKKGLPAIEGIFSVIENLSKKFRLAIVSSNHKRVISHQLKEYGLREAFQLIVGQEDRLENKPSPDSLIFCMERMQSSREESIYIGDMVTDILAARSAGIPVLAVTWGWQSEEKLSAENPNWIARVPHEIQEIITS